MRHIQHESDALGIGHTVQIIHKTAMKQFTNQHLIRSLTSNPPDNIYIHLGINNIHQQDHPTNICEYLHGFLNSLAHLQSTTIVISLPLRNGYTYQYSANAIKLLRSQLTTLLQNFYSLPQFQSRIYRNTNDNLFDRLTRNNQDTPLSFFIKTLRIT